MGFGAGSLILVGENHSRREKESGQLVLCPEKEKLPRRGAEGTTREWSQSTSFKRAYAQRKCCIRGRWRNKSQEVKARSMGAAEESIARNILFITMYQGRVKKKRGTGKGKKRMKKPKKKVESEKRETSTSRHRKP